MAPNHSRKPLGSILGPLGSHWGKKIGQNRKKLPCPKIRIFDYSAVIDLGKKIEFTVMAPNHGGDPSRVHFGPMGSHWGQKMGQNCKKLPCPKIRIFDYSAVIDLCKKSNLRLWCQITVGTPRSILGPMGFHWGEKMGQNRKKLPCPIIRILTTPRLSIWAKNRIYGYDAKSRCWPPRSIWGPMGSHWGQKIVKTVKSYYAPKFVFWLLRSHRFGQKIEFMVMIPNRGGDPLGPS